MPTKTVVISLIAITLVVIVFVLARDTEDQAIIDQLVRQQELSAPEVSLQATSADLQPDLFKLTDNLNAEKDGERGCWRIEPKQGSSYVRVPFPPAMDGSFPRAEQSDEATTPDSNPGFVGARACRECHQQKYNGFIHTAHHKTSGLVEPSNVHGAFSQPDNVLRTGDENLNFTMSERNGKYFQKVNFADWSMNFPLDVFTGSAKTGQSFLYWHHDALFQSHVSYLSEPDVWVPSPGYSGTQAEYTRVIRTGCLECHITYIDQKRGPNVYHRDSAIWGISCERCHGPGRDHVQYHQDHPNEKTSKYIVHPNDLPRERQLEICGQCHAGSFALIGDAFSYRPGDELDKFHKLLNPDFEGVGSIHTSNQLTRLKMSKCFQESEMTCTTCHNPHENQRGDLAVFTKSCLNCHHRDHCGMSEELGDRITDNCIACHMPIGDNEGMTLQLSRGTFSVTMIDHFIRVDKQATTEQLAK
jgi:hypothetical protein